MCKGTHASASIPGTLLRSHMCACVHFIRNQFDLRQFLAALHRYCKRQQPGQQAERDEMRLWVERGWLADGGKRDGELKVGNEE